jgi:site-specific recombinase XerD
LQGYRGMGVNNQLATQSPNRQILRPDGVDNKDHRHRLEQFVRWLDMYGHNWFEPDLAAYRDYLQDRRLMPTSIRAHLATIRSNYDRMMNQNWFIEVLYNTARQARPDGSAADHKALVDEAIRQLKNDLNPDNAKVKIVTVQDEADEEHIRLTVSQANSLLRKPGTDTLRGLADTCAIALMLCTGIREAELCGLDGNDLRCTLGGKLALRVKEGKRCKKRLIPYGAMDWVLVLVDRWMTLSGGAPDSPVFRGFVKGNKRLTNRRVSVKWVERMLSTYPIAIDGGLVAVKPHDLRRTYARRLYDAGMPIEAIQQNMGHDNRATTLHYIGTLDVAQRSPDSVFTFDLNLL